MGRHLPPLNAIRAFEAAARHRSFVGAAEELGVTAAAVSHHVKSLEDALDVQLFVRSNRSVSLTPTSQALLPGMRDSLDHLAFTINDVMRQVKGDYPITIRVPSALAAKWLTPRLDQFFSAFPDCPVRLELVTRTPDRNPDVTPADSDLDLTILQSAQRPSEDSVGLFSDYLFPVCAPVLRVALGAPGHLSRQTLLVGADATGQDGSALAPERSGSLGQAWEAWLSHAGVAGLHPDHTRVLPYQTLCLSDAMHAKGVALGAGSLVEAELRSGALVRPFQISVLAPARYWIVPPSGRLLRPQIQPFMDWLVTTARTFVKDAPHLVC